MSRNQTPTAKIIVKLKKNKLALFGLAFILLTFLVAVFGYLITADQSPMTNEMHLEISTQKPLSKVMFLSVRKNKLIEKVSVWEKIIHGEESCFEFVPISQFEFTDSTIEVVTVGDALKLKYNLADLVYPIEEKSRIYYKNKSFLFVDLFGKEIQITTAELVEKISKEQIIKRIYWLGTDRYGRDMLSRIIIGSRVSLSVGLVSVIISVLIGVTLGAIAGFYRGFVDEIISWLINVIWSLPSLLLVIAISFALGKGFWQVFIAIGLSMWVEVARLVRGQILSVREMEYVEAARALGYKNFRIIYRHILPNIFGPLMVIAAANFASAILLEAGLSFLGFGAQPPMPTWGGMVKEHYGYIIIDAAYLAIIPGLAIMFLVFAFNIFSSGLRDAFDMKENNITV